MALEAPLFMQGNTYAARRLRELVGYIFDTEGVVKPETGALRVSARAAGANMSVDVAAGTCAILGDDQAGQGMYLCPSTAVENLPIGAAPGSNSRIDLVTARLRDAAVTGGTASDWILEVIPGTVAASPVAPAVPASAIPLAQITVAAGTLSIDAAKITDRRTAATNAAYASRLATGAHVITGISQSLPNATDTVLTWEAELHDHGGCHDNATNNSRITVPAGKDGLWHLDLTVAFAANSTGVRRINIRRNGVIQKYGGTAAVSGDTTRVTLSVDVIAAAGDYFEAAAMQSSGAALGIVGNSSECGFNAHRVGATA